MPRKIVEVKGLKRVLSKFRRKNRRLSKYTREALDNYGEEIRDLAQMMAPRDTGALEQSIRLNKLKVTPFTYRSEVIVDGNNPYSGPYRIDGNNSPRATRVGQYAVRVHDTFAPGHPENEYKLGKNSQLKQNANPGIEVGGEFMTRSFDEIAPEARRAMRRDLRRIAKK